MKLLLDESLPRRLAKSFPDRFDVSTVQDNGWGGTTNGDLLRLASESGFLALITADRGFAHQQNPRTLPIIVVVLKSFRTRFSELAPLIPQVVNLLESDPELGVYDVNA